MSAAWRTWRSASAASRRINGSGSPLSAPAAWTTASLTSGLGSALVGTRISGRLEQRTGAARMLGQDHERPQPFGGGARPQPTLKPAAAAQHSPRSGHGHAKGRAGPPS